MTLDEQTNLLRSLSFIKSSPDDWVITGGMAMQLYGLRDNNADIDILVWPPQFDLLSKSPLYTKGGKNSQGVLNNDILILMHNGTKLVEVMKREPDAPDFKNPLVYSIPDTNINIPYIKPELLLSWKLTHNRPKDKDDIDLLIKYVAKGRGIELEPKPVDLGKSSLDLETSRKFKHQFNEVYNG